MNKKIVPNESKNKNILGASSKQHLYNICDICGIQIPQSQKLCISCKADKIKKDMQKQEEIRLKIKKDKEIKKDEKIDKLIENLKTAYELYENDVLGEYDLIVKQSDIPEFWKGYICRYMEEESRFQGGEKALINSIIGFIENLNIK